MDFGEETGLNLEKTHGGIWRRDGIGFGEDTRWDMGRET